MEQWITTTDTKMAAAYGTLGMPVRIKNTFDALTATEDVRFQIGLVNVEGTMKTQTLRGCLKNGTLLANQPGHPLLNILRAYSNRALVLDCANKGQMIELVQVPGTRIFRYVKGDRGLAGVGRGDIVLRTGDLKMVAALGVVGCELLKIEGNNGARVYTVRALAQCQGQPVDGGELMRAWRADMESIPWEHPFAQAARGLYNRERLLDCVRRCVRTIQIRKKNQIKSALIEEDATDGAWDKVSEFLGG